VTGLSSRHIPPRGILVVTRWKGCASNEAGNTGAVLGSIVFDARILGDSISETVGYKAGLALSLDEICEHLSGTDYPDIIRASEEHPVRLRADEYGALFYKLLHRVGYTEEEYDGDIYGIGLCEK
jgi:restriction system protein